MPQPIVLPRERSIWEIMMPQMLQMFMSQKMQQGQLDQKAEQANLERQHETGVRGQALDVQMQREGRMPLTDQWASKGGVQGGVVNPYSGKSYGPKPQPQIHQKTIGGKPFVVIKDQDGSVKLTQVKEPTKKSLTKIELTRQALKGDKEAKAILEDMHNKRIEEARALGQAQALGRTDPIDTTGTARAIIAGRENFAMVKNTFGVSVQEMVRKEVLKLDPDFNFVKPRVTEKAIQASISQQFKQRGMMGSFVKNLNKQLSRTDEIMKDVISRIGIRAIDLPKRELITRFKGSGHEKVLESYLIEISNEIGKLSTGSAASIRELSTDAQERWASIHDPNLSIKELKIILDETQEMANMRLASTDEEIEETMNLADNLRKKRKFKPKEESNPSSRFKILKVE